jgi:hypothetical protein
MLVQIDKFGIATPVSPIDYLKGAPAFDGSGISPAQFLTKAAGGETVEWTELDAGGGVPGPPGADGPDVDPGYAIDVTGTDPRVVDFDPTEITSFTAANFQFLNHNPIVGAPVKEDPFWRTVSNYLPEDQFWWHRSGSFAFKKINSYDDTQHLQFFCHFDGDWTFQTATGYDPTNKNQLLWSKKPNAGWEMVEADQINIKNITAIAVTIEGGSNLQVRLTYDLVQVYGKTLSTGNTLDGTLALTSLDLHDVTENTLEISEDGAKLRSIIHRMVKHLLFVGSTSDGDEDDLIGEVDIDECEEAV